MKKEDLLLLGLTEHQARQIAEINQKEIEIKMKSTGSDGNFGRKGLISDNPWSKDNFNLTKQARIIKENPAMAKLYMEQAN